MQLVTKIKGFLSDLQSYWSVPKPRRYMPFREIAAYSGGGIGAYMLITLGTACLLSTGNTLISGTLGVDPTDMYIMYVVAVLSNIPLTGIRANIIDNTRNKAGKYRPYIVTMAIPTAIVCVLMVWFPYAKMYDLFPGALTLGSGQGARSLQYGYIIKCALIMLFNFILNFFYYFFYDAYENLIHVLSPNTQERADVSSVKAVVYSFAPTVVNLFTPIIAKNIFHTNTTDIRVYRFLYPILAVIGILLCIVVYKYTEEKILQARTHVVQIKLSDALRAVAKNKYFWIISLATWIGFLETAYANILYWLYNYGGVCNGNVYGLVVTIYGNASLWGMLLAPFCIKKWGKKAVLVITNIFNIVFILMMLPFTNKIDNLTIWLVMGCLYLNAFMGSFAHILNPAIQADIRDYQQYITGERIDGMFSAINTIGTVIALVTSAVLPYIYKRGGINEATAISVTSNPNILNRMLGDGQTVGQLLQQQLANGQNNYINPYSALYDTNILLKLLHVLIIVSAFGALLNVIPYIWYDFTEKKQKSIVRVLQVRALFEDYGNGIINDGKLVESIDIIRNARETAVLPPRTVDKNSYKSIKNDKELRKSAKKNYYKDLEFNEEIEISQFVCAELDKFTTDTMKHQLKSYTEIYNNGLNALLSADMSEIKAELAEAKAMPKSTEGEKELRKFAIELARSKKSSRKAIDKYFKNVSELTQPDFAALEQYFDEEDECDARLRQLNLDLKDAKEKNDAEKFVSIKKEIKAQNFNREAARKASKAEMDKQAYFARAAKPYLDAKKIIEQAENYTHLEEIDALYDEAKARHEAKLLADAEEAARLKLRKML